MLTANLSLLVPNVFFGLGLLVSEIQQIITTGGFKSMHLIHSNSSEIVPFILAHKPLGISCVISNLDRNTVEDFNVDQLKQRSPVVLFVLDSNGNIIVELINSLLFYNFFGVDSNTKAIFIWRRRPTEVILSKMEAAIQNYYVGDFEFLFWGESIASQRHEKAPEVPSLDIVHSRNFSSFIVVDDEKHFIDFVRTKCISESGTRTRANAEYNIGLTFPNSSVIG